MSGWAGEKNQTRPRTRKLGWNRAGLGASPWLLRRSERGLCGWYMKKPWMGLCMELMLNKPWIERRGWRRGRKGISSHSALWDFQGFRRSSGNYALGLIPSKSLPILECFLLFNIYVCIHLAVPGLICSVWDISLWHGNSSLQHMGSSSRPGMDSAPALGLWSLSHWTPREVPILSVVTECRNLERAQIECKTRIGWCQMEKRWAFSQPEGERAVGDKEPHWDPGGQLPGRQGGGRECIARRRSGRDALCHQRNVVGEPWGSSEARMLLTFWRAYPGSLLGEPGSLWQPVRFLPGFFWAFGVTAGQSLCGVIRNQVTVTFPLEPSQANSPQILLLDALASALSHKMPFGSFASVFDYWVNILVSWLHGVQMAMHEFASLTLFAFSYITSAPGMPESINMAYLVNYLLWNIWERERITSDSWHGVSSCTRGFWSWKFFGSRVPSPSRTWCRPSSSWTLQMKGGS